MLPSWFPLHPGRQGVSLPGNTGKKIVGKAAGALFAGIETVCMG